MHFKTIICAACFFAIVSGTSAQRTVSGSSVPGNKQFYTEFGGPGVMFSANYDQRFDRNQATGFGFRIGIGYSSFSEHYYYDTQGPVYSQSNKRHYDSRSWPYATFPVGLNYVFGKNTSPHAFEIGAGATILTSEKAVYNFEDDPSKPRYFIGHFSFMYRRLPTDSGFTWRIGFTPIIGTSGDIIPSAAISLGYAF